MNIHLAKLIYRKHFKVVSFPNAIKRHVNISLSGCGHLNTGGVEVQRFNGGREENRMISQCQGKERQLSGAECDMQREKQPLNQQQLQVKILELKVFMIFVCATDLSWLRGFQPFQSWSQKTEIYVTQAYSSIWVTA